MLKLAMIGAVSLLTFSQVAIACPCKYPLDASPEQYTSLGFTPFPVVTGRTASYNIEETGIEKHFAAVSGDAADAFLQSGLGGDITLPSSGIVGVEMRIDSFPKKLTNVLSDKAILFLMVASGSNYRFRVMMGTYPSSAAVFPYSEVNGVGTFATGIPVSLPLAKGYRIGIYFNMSTHQAGYTLNGVDMGYVSTIPTGITDIALVLGGDVLAQSGENLIGKKVSGTLITQAKAMNQPFPQGTKDVCGNLIQ